MMESALFSSVVNNVSCSGSLVGVVCEESITIYDGDSIIKTLPRNGATCVALRDLKVAAAGPQKVMHCEESCWKEIATVTNDDPVALRYGKYIAVASSQIVEVLTLPLAALTRIPVPRIRDLAFNDAGDLAIVGTDLCIWSSFEVNHVAVKARCVAGRRNDFLVIADAPINLFGPSDLREATQKNIPTITARIRTHGEPSSSGFGGGAIPSFLRPDIGPKKNDGASVFVVGWDSAEQIATLSDVPAAIVDMIAVSNHRAVVASSFANVVGFYDLNFQEPHVEPLPTSSGHRRRVRGLGLCHQDAVVLVTDSSQQHPISSTSKKKTAPEAASLIHVPAPRRLIAPVVAEPEPTPSEQQQQQQQHVVNGAPPPPPPPAPVVAETGTPEASLTALREHVDRRLDTLEAKLDSLLLLVASTPRK